MPDDLDVFEVALLLHKTPDEVRLMSERDRAWVRVVKGGLSLAEAEAIKRR